jgi:hypothetical protein
MECEMQKCANELSDSDAAICAFYAFLREFRTGETLFGINRVGIGRFLFCADLE